MNTITYRVKRSRVLMWLVGFVMFGSIAAFFGLLLAAPEFVDARPATGVGVVVGRGLFTAFAVTISCCFLVALVIELGGRLTMSQNWVEWADLFRCCRVDLSQVVEARWRWGNELRLRTPQAKLTIDFGAYPPPQPAELIRFFRFALRTDVQSGWEAFWRMNWTRFDKADRNDPDDLAAKQALRRRINVYLAALPVLVGAVFLYQWSSGLGEQDPLFWRHWLILSLGFAILLVFLAFVCFRMEPPKHGPIQKRHQPPSEDRVAWLAAGFFVALLAVFLGRLGLQQAGWPIAAEVVTWPLVLAVFVVLVTVMSAHSNRTNAWRREAARLAEQEYMSPADSS